MVAGVSEDRSRTGKRPPQAVVNRYMAAVGRLDKHEPLQLELKPSTVLLLVAQLQLALRHPQNTGPSAVRMRELAHWLEEQIERLEPDLQPILELGWDPDYDQE